MYFLGGALGKQPPAKAGDTGWIPYLGRSHVPRSNEARIPQLLTLACPGTRAPQEKPPQWAACTSRLESSSRSVQLENRPSSNEDSGQSETNTWNYKEIFCGMWNSNFDVCTRIAGLRVISGWFQITQQRWVFGQRSRGWQSLYFLLNPEALLFEAPSQRLADT